MSGQEVAPVPSEQAVGVPGESGSRVCLRHVLRQLVDDRERRPPALLGAVQLAQGPVGQGSSFSVSAVALCTLSCPPRGGPAEGQRGLEAAGTPSLWRAGPTANSGQGGQDPGGPGARWTSDKSVTWDSGRVSPGLWAPRAHITGTDPVCSDAGCSNRVRDAGPGSGTSCQATSSPERRFVPSPFHGQTGTLSPSSPGPWSQGVRTWPGLSRPRGWQREGLSLDCSAALSALGLSRGIGHVGVSLPQPWGVLWHL